MEKWKRWLFNGIGAALIVATALPLIPSNEWWIRFFDFPRAQIAAIIFIVLVGLAVVRHWKTRGGKALMGALILCLAYQLSRILPYTPPWPAELPNTGACAPADRLRYMEVNVLQTNRNAKALLDLVAAERPDILLLTETDQWWADRVQPLAREMPHVVSVPQSNTYGMMLMSRLPLGNSQVRYLIEPDVPSIRARVQLSGQTVMLHAVHPRPPTPGQDTEERDAELVLVGREIRQDKMPAIVAGDLNDVAWSDTTSLFQEASGLLDPRVGRKLMPTFPADFPFLRWPLDYIFVSPGFELISMKRFGNIGSDHLPVSVELCAAKVARRRLPSSRLDGETKQEVNETIAEGKEEAAER